MTWPVYEIAQPIWTFIFINLSFQCNCSWKEIEKSETLAKLFPEPPIVAFRRPKSIKDTLVRAAVSRPSSTVGQCKPCGDKRCKWCLQLQHTQVFHRKTTGKEYKIYIRLKIKPNSVRIRFLSCQIFALPSTGFELRSLIHCSTNRLALSPAP